MATRLHMSLWPTRFTHTQNPSHLYSGEWFIVSVLCMCISHMAPWKKISTQIFNTCQSIRVDGKWFSHVGIGVGHECMCLWFTTWRRMVLLLRLRCLITFIVWHCYHVVDVQTMVYTHITGMFLRNTIKRIPRHWNLCRC